jgi:hypothetical protein
VWTIAAPGRALNTNRLSGSIPSSIGALANLQQLYALSQITLNPNEIIEEILVSNFAAFLSFIIDAHHRGWVFFSCPVSCIKTNCPPRFRHRSGNWDS